MWLTKAVDTSVSLPVHVVVYAVPSLRRPPVLLARHRTMRRGKLQITYQSSAIIHSMSKIDITSVRHSLAHVLAAATRRLYGDSVKLGVGPAIENGFYYDMDLGETHLTDDDLPKIEAEMRRIIAEKQPFERSTKTIAEAEKWAQENDQPYKLELIQDFQHHGTTKAGAKGKEQPASSEMSFYTNGDFTDLCMGGHVANTGDIPADGFHLTKIAGAYFRGDETNDATSLRRRFRH